MISRIAFYDPRRVGRNARRGAVVGVPGVRCAAREQYDGRIAHAGRNGGDAAWIVRPGPSATRAALRRRAGLGVARVPSGCWVSPRGAAARAGGGAGGGAARPENARAGPLWLASSAFVVSAGSGSGGGGGVFSGRSTALSSISRS